LEEALRLPFDGLGAVERGHGARAMKENP
jgi:hypothetical protein